MCVCGWVFECLCVCVCDENDLEIDKAIYIIGRTMKPFSVATTQWSKHFKQMLSKS